MAAVLLRHVREGALTQSQAYELREAFVADVERGIWETVPLGDAFLDRVTARIGALAANAYVRAGDAIHLWAASEAGFREVWTNDRHMLGAAPHFGLKGRSV
jgi:predicted nucleic acid-binding protein